MIRYNYLGSGNFKYRWETLSADKLADRLCRLIDLDMWNEEYREFCKKYLNPYWQQDEDRIKTKIKILILILTARISGVLSSNIKLEGNNTINLQAEFGDGFKIYIQDPDKPGEMVYIDYRDDNNEALYKGNLSLIDLDTLLNDTTL